MTSTGAPNYSVSRRGDLVFRAGWCRWSAPSLRSLVWVDRKGQETPIPAQPRAYAVARISPDGTRVALDMRDQTNDIWIWDIMPADADAPQPRSGAGPEPVLDAGRQAHHLDVDAWRRQSEFVLAGRGWYGNAGAAHN